MKKTIFLLLTLTSGFASAVFHPKRRFKRSPLTYEFEEKYFRQILDHFDTVGNEKWWQRYYSLGDYYVEGGPAFLFVNGEWPVEPSSVSDLSGHWLSYAEELTAYCFSLEHRFYGKSWPKNGDMMRYLNMEQAGGDIAYFIQRITAEYSLPEDIKWIIFGCSYAGEVVTWTRLKYPHLVHGAIASSSTMWYKATNPEFFQVVEKSIRSYNPKCVESISLANLEMHNFYSKERNDEADKEVGSTESPESTSQTSDLWSTQETNDFNISTFIPEDTTPTSEIWSEIKTDFLSSTTTVAENPTSTVGSNNLSTKQETDTFNSTASSFEYTEQTSELWTAQETDGQYTSTAGPENTTMTFESWINENDYVDSLRELYQNMANILLEAVQYNDTAFININRLCDIMTDYSVIRFESYVLLQKMSNLFNEETSDDDEFINDIFNNNDDDNDDDDSNHYQDSRSYEFQICSEFGQLPVASKTSNLSIEHLLDSAEDQVQSTCGQFFGPNFTIDDLNEKIKYTNTIFGGLNFNVANTLFVHGSLDPWHVLGFYERKNDSLYQTVFIHGTSHCADMNHASDGDIEELKEARKQILEILKDWLRKM